MKYWITISLCLSFLTQVFSQGFPEGIAYQSQLRNSDGGYLSSADIVVEFNIRQSALDGTIVWQETHNTTTSNVGHISLNIGEGVSTGVGIIVSFDEIDWSASIYFIEMLIDEDLDGSFISSSTQQLMAVPYAFHSKTTDQEFSLSKLSDVDTSGIQIGDVLKWDGLNWVAAKDLLPDTVLYSHTAGVAVYSDTANFAWNCEDPEFVDSSFISIYSDTSNYAYSGGHSIYSDSAAYADTAGIANYAINNWGINGNDNILDDTYFLGTTDSIDLILKSYNVERMRIKANGLIGIGTDNPLVGFHVDNSNGLLFTGEFGAGSIPASGAGGRMMWYPAKAAFRTGYVTGTQWNDAFIGNYSFAAGYSTKASGDYSVAFGNGSFAGGEGAFAVGNVATSTGDYSFSAGHNPTASGEHSVAIGRGTVASNESALALGYHSTSSGPFSVSIGDYSTSSGSHSFSLGYHARSIHNGAFVFGDISTETYLNTTAENQFMVRAAGGTIFYTSSDLTTGVELLPGAGAWSILSDSTRKENIIDLNGLSYLSVLDSLPVYSWSYISQDSSIRHIGPMAQDFYAAFKLGNDETTINSGDFDGVNLLLIKALYEKIEIIEEQAADLEQLEKELKQLEEKRTELLMLLQKLESRIDADKVLTSENN